MSSTFTTKKTKKKQGFLGGVFGGDEKVWLQFVPGNVIEVLQYNHGHHGANNLVRLKGIEPDSLATQTTGELKIDDTVLSF